MSGPDIFSDIGLIVNPDSVSFESLSWFLGLDLGLIMTATGSSPEREIDSCIFATLLLRLLCRGYLGRQQGRVGQSEFF